MPVPQPDALVFDVLGTLVDEPAGIRSGIRAFAPALDDAATERLLALWQRHIGREQGRIAEGGPYRDSAALDREAARQVADAVGAGGDGSGGAAAVEALARSARRLPPWPDTRDGLARLAERFPLVGLSNASRSALLELNAYAGLRWHLALSAEDARAYKPSPEVYRLAVEASGRPPERLLMVAAHAWDLRGAQSLGMRTAYVRRPVGDPPAPSDRFDLYAEGLADLADQLDRA
ncbi:haloacid dehalogenase type II [Nocardiopsis chromatogenes]|uniref:haloacid dehalogenase type II n=1 Tax=Nocardiopsis chromatogenes TaxID=280239 RepID=UPI00034C1BF3|nr:haloacid dehalogenase type II [Nocardiopsis chromatogenes]